MTQQRYEHKDPRPDLPYEDDLRNYIYWPDFWVLATCAFAGVLLVLVL